MEGSGFERPTSSYFRTMKNQLNHPDDPLHSPKTRDIAAALPLSDGSVRLRTMNEADANAYAAGTNDAEVKRFAHLPLDHYTPAIVRDLINGVIADGLRDASLAILTIADEHTNTFIGSLVLFDITADSAEIGYWVSSERRGQGVASRSLELSITLARTLGLQQLHARTVQDNAASSHVLLRAGFAQASPTTRHRVPA